MKIDWLGVLVALLVSFLAFFVLVKFTDAIGFCLDHNISGQSCIAKAEDVVLFAPTAFSIAFLRSIVIPIISFSLAILYYFRGHPIENWHDTLLPAFVIGSLSGIATIFVLYFYQTASLMDFVYIFSVLSWFGFFIGIAVFCAVIGGVIAYMYHRRE